MTVCSSGCGAAWLSNSSPPRASPPLLPAQTSPVAYYNLGRYLDARREVAALLQVRTNTVVRLPLALRDDSLPQTVALVHARPSLKQRSLATPL